MENTKLINEIITEASGDFTLQQLEKLRMILIESFDKYDITPKERNLVVFTTFTPDCLKTYLVTKKIEGKSMETLKLYTFYLRKFFEMVNTPLEQIDSNTIRLFLFKYQQETQISNRTLDSIRACLSAFFTWANSEGYIPRNPSANVMPIKYEQKDREPLDDIELEKLRNVLTNKRDKAIVEFFYSTGCRVSEVTGVKISDIDIAKRECEVLGKGNKHRKVYINSRCELAINDYLASTNRTYRSEGYLFIPLKKTKNEKLSTDTLEIIIKELGEKAGIDRRVFPHLLRHTSATNALYHGTKIEQVQRILGHSNINTTMIYSKVNDADVKLAYMKSVI